VARAPPPPPPLPEGALGMSMPRPAPAEPGSDPAAVVAATVAAAAAAVAASTVPVPVGLQNQAAPPMPPATQLARRPPATQLGQLLQPPSPQEVSRPSSLPDAPLLVGLQPSACASASSIPAALVDALRANNLSEARHLLQERADINGVEGHSSRTSPLFHVLESGANVEAVNLMLKARSNVNFMNPVGESSLHYAIRNYSTMCPLVIRMLLHAQADLNKEDAKGVSPIEIIRMISTPEAGQEVANVRQILNEVTDMPTLEVVILDRQEPILSAHFADTQNDKVVFNTSSSIGVYSLVQRQVVFVRKLRQKQVVSSVKSISVNPELGTLAICLEVWQTSSSLQNIFIIWPSGQLQDETPLKLSITVDPHRQGMRPPAVMLSRCQGPQWILGRLVDSKVYSWGIDKDRLELKIEFELADSVSTIAVSDDGCWISVVCDSEGSSFVKIFSYESATGILHEPLNVYTQQRGPQAMAIQQRSSGGGIPCAHLALVDPVTPGSPPPPIEIFQVGVDSSWSMIFRLKVPSGCKHIGFCHGVTTHLVSSHEDGLTVLYNLVHSTTTQCHVSPETASLSISADRTLAVVTEYNCFRIFRTPPEALQT